MIAKHFAGLLVVSLGLALPACTNTESKPIPLTEQERAELAAARESNYGPTKDRGTLFVTLDRNLRTWNDAVAKKMGDDLHLTDRLESVLERHVYWNFDVILDELKNGSDRNRVIAAAALGFAPTTAPDGGRPQSKDAAEALVATLAADDDLLIQNALVGLAQIADSDTPREPIVDLLLRHHNPDVRANAALAMAHIITPGEGSRWLADLSAALDDDEPKVRMHVVNALGRVRHPDAAFQITRALNDKTPNVQAAAAKALGDLGIPGMCRYLIDKMTSTTAIVRLQAHDSLCLLAGKNLGEHPDDWRAWCSEQQQQQVERK
jgi:HEAT repeat protein